ADRSRVAELLGFEGYIQHTRDAMWQIDGLIAALSHASSLLTTQSKLAEDLEIWASNEFDYITIADGFSRSSVLMPQKRNPYALSIIRGASGTLIGRLTGFLAVSKSPSARSDNLIYAYGEIPRALDLALRTTRLTSGVIRSMTVNADRMWEALESGFSQATDLAEYVMQTCQVDYRTAYQVVGIAVRQASREGLRGIDLNAERLEAAAQQYAGISLGLEGRDLSEILDPRHIVETRTLAGGAAPPVVEAMAAECATEAEALLGRARAARDSLEQAEAALVELAENFLKADPSEGPDNQGDNDDRHGSRHPGAPARGGERRQRRAPAVRRGDHRAAAAGRPGGLADPGRRRPRRGRRAPPAVRQARGEDRRRQPGGPAAAGPGRGADGGRADRPGCHPRAGRGPGDPALRPAHRGRGHRRPAPPLDARRDLRRGLGEQSRRGRRPDA